MEASPDHRAELTQLLEQVARGDAVAEDRLLPLVYSELRQIARAQMARESPGHTLQPTALVHEAYLRLFGNRSASFVNRAHFFAAARRGDAQDPDRACAVQGPAQARRGSAAGRARRSAAHGRCARRRAASGRSGGSIAWRSSTPRWPRWSS